MNLNKKYHINIQINILMNVQINFHNECSSECPYEYKKRGYVINKLIVLIPGKICYRPVLQPASNYEK